MTVRSPTYLKALFENGDIPVQTDYEDVFDSYLPINASGAYTVGINLTVNGTFNVSGQSTFTSVQANVVSAAVAYVGNLVVSGTVASLNIDRATVSAMSATIVSADTFNGQTVQTSALTGTKAVFSGIVSALTVNADNLQTSALRTGSINATGIVSAATLNAVNVSANSIHVQTKLKMDFSLVSANSTTQAGGTVLNSSISWVNYGTGNHLALTLPAGDVGRVQYIVNAASTILKIFPPSGGAFVGTANNASLNLPTDKGATILHGSTTSFIMIVSS